MERKTPSLCELLQYKNELVIKRFKLCYPDWADEADEIYNDMLKYLWLSQKHRDENKLTPLRFDCVMHKEMLKIDEMWHTFILITKDYTKFCNDFFGGYIHHVPEVGEEATGQEVSVEKFEWELTLFLSYVYDNLGEKTVLRWFGEYVHTKAA